MYNGLTSYYCPTAVNMPDGTSYKCYEGHGERVISSELRISLSLAILKTFEGLVLGDKRIASFKTLV